MMMNFPQCFWSAATEQDHVSVSSMNKRTRELNGPLGAADYQSGLLSDFVPSLLFFVFFIMSLSSKLVWGWRPRLEPSVQLSWLSGEVMVALQSQLAKFYLISKTNHIFTSPPSVICQFPWKLKCHQLLPSGTSSGTSAACFRRRVASCVAWSLSAGMRMKLD